MRHHRLGLLLSLALAFTLSACAFFRAVAAPVSALVCDALVDVIDPGSGAVAAKLCPALAAEVSKLLAEDGNAGRVSRHGGACDPVQVHEIESAAPRGAAYYCGGRLGGRDAAAELHARAVARLKEGAR